MTWTPSLWPPWSEWPTNLMLRDATAGGRVCWAGGIVSSARRSTAGDAPENRPKAAARQGPATEAECPEVHSPKTGEGTMRRDRTASIGLQSHVGRRAEVARARRARAGGGAVSRTAAGYDASAVTLPSVPGAGSLSGRRAPGAGSRVSPDFAFCPKCGARLRGAAPAAAPVARARRRRPRPPRRGRPAAGQRAVRRRRRLHPLGEQLDPEDVRAFQDDLFRELRGAIEQHGGFVEKFVGDAVMAIFGAPVAHEDDPERALRAALAHARRA